MAEAGSVVHTFPRGQGDVIDNPIMPVVEITGEPETVRTMGGPIAVDVSDILPARRRLTLQATI